MFGSVFLCMLTSMYLFSILETPFKQELSNVSIYDHSYNYIKKKFNYEKKILSFYPSFNFSVK